MLVQLNFLYSTDICCLSTVCHGALDRKPGTRQLGPCPHTAHILLRTGRHLRNKLEARKYPPSIIPLKKLIRACDRKWVGLVGVGGHFNWGDQGRPFCEGGMWLISRRTKCWGSYPSRSLFSLRNLINYLQIKPTPCQILIQIRSPSTYMGYSEEIHISILSLKTRVLRYEQAW